MEDILPIPKQVEEERAQRASSADELAHPIALKRKKTTDESIIEQEVSLVTGRKAQGRSAGSVAEKVVADGAVELKGAARGEKVSDQDATNTKRVSTAVTSKAQTEKLLAQEPGITKELSLSTDTEMAASSDGEDGSSESTPTARSRNSKKRDDARMRNLLLQQLMAQHSNKVQREKILKALIALGISEVEYRNLLVKLGEMEVARQAEQAAATVKIVEPIALAVEVPTMKHAGAEPSAQRPAKPTVDAATTSRAALYKRLKQDASAFRK
jgi:hypothetical protein